MAHYRTTVDSQQPADKVYAYLADFATVARTKSKDPESGPRGGDLGWVQAGTLVESFDRTLYTLKAGEHFDGHH